MKRIASATLSQSILFPFPLASQGCSGPSVILCLTLISLCPSLLNSSVSSASLIPCAVTLHPLSRPSLFLSFLSLPPFPPSSSPSRLRPTASLSFYSFLSFISPDSLPFSSSRSTFSFLSFPSLISTSSIHCFCPPFSLLSILFFYSFPLFPFLHFPVLFSSYHLISPSFPSILPFPLLIYPFPSFLYLLFLQSLLSSFPPLSPFSTPFLISLLILVLRLYTSL